MGLSSKQVISSSGQDWKQTLSESQDLKLPKPHNLMKKQHQQQTEHVLNCPRCDSTNTKFCYYNNYNKSQPRHFCRACKRHWTKGGTLRNVPVGGGRKNKRIKKLNIPITSSIINTTTSCTTSIMNGGVNSNNTPLASSLYQALIHPPSLILQQNMMNSSNLHIPHQNQSLIFPFSTSSSFDTTICSSSNVCYYGDEFKAMEEPMIPTTNTKPWEIPSSGIESSKFWNWEDIDSLVSTDLEDPYWDDSDINQGRT